LTDVYDYIAFVRNAVIVAILRERFGDFTRINIPVAVAVDSRISFYFQIVRNAVTVAVGLTFVR
jgi:hypothetical protein